MKKILLLLLLVIILSNSVNAISLQGSGFRPNPRVFEPGLSFNFGFLIARYNYGAEPYIDGDLKEYASIYNVVNQGSSILFNVKLELPESIEEPGIHELYIGATEIAPPGAGIVGLTRAQKLIKILVLFEEKKAKYYEFTTPDLNENESTDFNFYAESISKQYMNGLWANIKIFDSEKNLLRTMRTQNFDLLSGEQKIINIEFNSAGLSSGLYFTEAEIHSIDEIIILESSFRLGMLNMEILDYTKELQAGKINKIDILLENKWNGNIKSVYADLSVDDNKLSSTQTYSFGPFEKKSIQGFIDLSDIDAGQHTLKIVANYDGEKKHLEENIIFSENPDKKSEPILEMPKFNNISIMMILVIVILVLVIVILKQKNKK